MWYQSSNQVKYCNDSSIPYQMIAKISGPHSGIHSLPATFSYLGLLISMTTEQLILTVDIAQPIDAMSLVECRTDFPKLLPLSEMTYSQ